MEPRRSTVTSDDNGNLTINEAPLPDNILDLQSVALTDTVEHRHCGDDCALNFGTTLIKTRIDLDQSGFFLWQSRASHRSAPPF